MSFHNLVNTAQFQYTARDFKKNGGMYTRAPKGSRDYFQFWEEEEKRCLYGYKCGDLWIPGRFYHYLNHFPIARVPETVMIKALEERRSSNGRLARRAVEKILDFPGFWEIAYEWYMFKHIAWYGGEFMGIKSPGNRHLCTLKTRGAGFSYWEAQDGCYNYNFIPGSKSYYFAGTLPYLDEDGILNKVQGGLDWMNQHSPYWKKNRQVHKNVMHQKASYLDSYGMEKGSMAEIIGQVVDKPSKAHPYSANIITPDGPKKWSDIQVGNKVFGSDGKVINVEATVELGEQDIYTITLEDGRTVQATEDHLWVISRWITRQKNKKLYATLIEETIDTKEIIRRLKQSWHSTARLKIKLSGCTNYPEQAVPIDAYTMGLILGDGSIGNSTKNLSYLTMMHEDVEEIKKYIPYKVEKENWGTGIRNKIHIHNGKQLFIDLNLFDKRSGTKFIPDVYKYNSAEIRLEVINGLLDTDGSVTKDFGVIEYSTKSEQLADDFIWIVHSLGFGGTVKSRIIKGTVYYRCYIYCLSAENKLFNLPRKKSLISTKKLNAKAVNIALYSHIKSVKFSHREQAKCIQVDAKDSLYLIEDHIITHNTRGKRGRKATFEEGGSFPNLESALEVAMGSMTEGADEEGSMYVGQITIGGTGGEQGPGIQGLENIFDNPDAWDMLKFPNVWDGDYTGGECGYFVPCWRANSWAMDESGNVDMEFAIKADEIQRAKKKRSKKPKDLDRRIAEYPRNPREALQRMNGNGFNIAEIDKQIKRLESSKELQGMIRHGVLTRNPDAPKDDGHNGVEFTVQPKHIAKPIEDFPHNQKEGMEGCVSIVERPYTDAKGRVPVGMYKITFDAYAKEDAEDQTSLWSWKVWKMDNNVDPKFGNLPVAWGCGRMQRYQSNIDRMFMAADYYNAMIQGEIAGGGQSVVTHAKTYRLLHKICHEPEMAHNKEIASKSAGNSYLMNMATERKNLGLTYLEDWHVQIRGVDEKGVPILNVHRIYDIAWLKEMRKHNPTKGNYDRISDALVAMFELKENYALQIRYRRKQRAFWNKQLYSPNTTDTGETTTAY